MDGGINLFAYAENNPIFYVDPTGELAIPGAIFGAAIDMTIQLIQNGGRFDCLDWQAVGLSAVLGAAGGWAGSFRRTGTEWSHWIPARKFSPRGRLPRWLDGSWNGSWTSNWRHYKHDPYRYSRVKGEWRNWGDKWNPFIQQLDRIPDWLKGSGLGGAAGSFAADCNC